MLICWVEGAVLTVVADGGDYKDGVFLMRLSLRSLCHLAFGRDVPKWNLHACTVKKLPTLCFGMLGLRGAVEAIVVGRNVLLTRSHRELPNVERKKRYMDGSSVRRRQHGGSHVATRIVAEIDQQHDHFLFTLLLGPPSSVLDIVETMFSDRLLSMKGDP